MDEAKKISAQVTLMAERVLELKCEILKLVEGELTPVAITAFQEAFTSFVVALAVSSSHDVNTALEKADSIIQKFKENVGAVAVVDIKSITGTSDNSKIKTH